MVEYLPIPVFPEVYNVYLIVGLTLAVLAGIALYLFKFSKTTHKKFFRVIKKISDLSKSQEKILREIDSIKNKINSMRTTTSSDSLFRFILLKYLATEKEFSPKDKLLFINMLSGEKPSPELVKLLMEKSKKMKISKEEAERIYSDFEASVKELLKNKIKERLK
jgi:hypothetical protein